MKKNKKPEETVKIFLDCDYKKKETAKLIGAKWCVESKKWYVSTIFAYSKWLKLLGEKTNIEKVDEKYNKKKGVYLGWSRITIGADYVESTETSIPWD